MPAKKPEEVTPEEESSTNVSKSAELDEEHRIHQQRRLGNIPEKEESEEEAAPKAGE